ncbi:MAG TPA: alkaline phosphatase family protein [Bryobacteraceae bacterium]|nr:alkaline phosphatase family protein [Bryobacteraceae bacterium]
MRLITTVLMSVGWLWSAWAQPSGQGISPHLIVIGIDGLSVDGVAKAKMPRLRELISRSAWTMDARGVMPTLSSPNWTSMITGAGTEQHGITNNGHLRRMMEFQPVLRNSAGIFPTVFAALRSQKPSSRIAIFHDWPGFADLVEKDAPDVLQHEHGASRTVEAATKYWSESRPDLLFIHLDNVDQAGHESGWQSAEYYQAVEKADSYVGVVLDMLDRLAAAESTYVLVTSDHGGKGRGHEKNILECIQIPWILTGPEIAAGRIAAPVYTFDTAATIAWIFGINLSEYAIGRPVRTAFRTPSTVAQGVTADSPSRNCAPERVVIPTGSGAGASPLANLNHGQRN